MSCFGDPAAAIAHFRPSERPDTEEMTGENRHCRTDRYDVAT
jgi:hypothetical protein